MPDLQPQRQDSVVLDVANEAVIAHPVTPQAGFVAVQGLAPLPRIFRGSKPGRARS
jgi:hypothetical protein